MARIFVLANFPTNWVKIQTGITELCKTLLNEKCHCNVTNVPNGIDLAIDTFEESYLLKRRCSRYEQKCHSNLTNALKRIGLAKYTFEES